MPHSTQYNIINSLVSACKEAKAEKIFISNRPKIGAAGAKYKSFAVIVLPSRLYRDVKGNTDFLMSTNGILSIGVEAKKDGQPNIERQTEIVQSFLDLFPINDDYISATNPVILMKGLDETNFQITHIMFDIRTKINQYLK